MNKKLFTLVYISLISLNIYAFDTSVVGSPNAPTTYTPTNGAYDPNNPWSSSGGINPVAPTTVQTPGNVVLTPTQPGTTPGSAITPTTQPGQAPVANKKWFDTLFGNKNCNYVDKKQYQPFSGIDETFPGAKTLGFEKSKVNKDVTCVNVSSATENIVKMVFTLAISIIIVLTIISISVSGIQYMTEEAIGKKGEAKKRLTNSFIALALGLLSYTILYTINKQLVEFSFNPSSIDTKNSVEKGIQSALTAATGTWTSGLSGIEAVNSVTPNYYNPYTPTPTFNPGFGFGWNETTAEQWVNSLPNGVRSTDGRLVITVYSASKDKVTDTNTSQRRGNANNLLREGSVALSPDLIAKYRPSTGQAVIINGTTVGFYEDATASSYNGVQFANTIDIYDENGTLGSSDILKNISPGQWNITFGSTRQQISNP